MGNEQYGYMDRFRVHIWGTAVVIRCGGKSAPARWLSERSRTGRESTKFNKCWAEGHPWPEVEGIEDRPGLAVRIEQEYPGTLIWLIHPIWRVIGQFPVYRLDQIFLDFLAMRPSVRELVLTQSSGSPDVWQYPVPDMLHALHKEGSLDALLALMLLSRQAYCYCDVVTYRLTLPTICELIQTIECLRWMPSYIRETFVSVLIHTIASQHPTVLTVDLAQARKWDSVNIDVSTYTGKTIKFTKADVEAALESSGVNASSAGSIVLPPKAMKTIKLISDLYSNWLKPFKRGTR